MRPVLLSYIPVLHQGYWQYFKESSDARELYLLSGEQAQEFTPHHKEIRSLDAKHIQSAIESWGLFESVRVLSKSDIAKLDAETRTLGIPNELVTIEFAKKYLPNCPTKRTSIFLRWDSKSATKQQKVKPTHTVAKSEIDTKFLKIASETGERSSDWWRRVGAVAVRDGEVLLTAHNTHLPSEQQPYAESDPRAHFHKGEHIELTTAIHAEAKLIAEAAKRGIVLEGAELYVTDFPCPICAKSVAVAGFKKLYFQKGYSMLDGERVLRDFGVDLFWVRE